MTRRTNYDQIAPAYDRRYVENDYGGIESALVEFLGRDPGLRVLELGCGTGHWLGGSRARDFRCAGLDPSPAMLARARASLAGVALVRARAEAIPWPEASFDRVFCINALHHFADREAAIREAARVLRPGGAFLGVGLDPHTGLDRWYVYDYFEETLAIDRGRYPPTAEIRGWLRGAGFTRCATRVVMHLPARIDAREALASERVHRGATSQLSVLTDAEYARGIERIRADVLRAEREGRAAVLTADLRLYGTYGIKA